MNVNSFLKCVREGQSPSKAEELEALFTFAHSFNQNTYLGSLFSSQFLEWVERHIQQDLSTDLMADLASAERERVAQAGRHKEAYDLVATELANLKLAYSEQNADLQREQENFETEHEKVLKAVENIALVQRLEQTAVAALERVMESATSAWQEADTVTPEELRGIVANYYESRERIIEDFG